MMASNQDHQVVYQASYPTYQAAAVTTWNQPPQSAPLAFALPYHADFSHETDMMHRQQPTPAYNNQYAAAQSNPWQQQQYSQQPPFHGFPGYNAAVRIDTYNHAAPQPNITRPPPPPLPMKRETDTFHGMSTAIAMLDNPAQTAAAYTASWVSSTSSIPPELRDEPDADAAVGHWEMRAPGGQWPGLHDDQRKNDKHGFKKRDDRRRDEPRELTWEERLKKAQVQKDRVEMHGVDGSGRAVNVAPRPRSYRDAPAMMQMRPNIINPMDKRPNNWKNDMHFMDGDKGGLFGLQDDDNRQKRNTIDSRFATSGSNVGSPGNLPPWNGFPPQLNTIGQNQNAKFPNRRGVSSGQNFARGGMRGPPPPPPPLPPPMPMPPTMMPFPPTLPQDQKFRNTWLDAHTYSPFVPLLPGFPLDPSRMGRGVPISRGRSGGAMRNGTTTKKEFSATPPKKEEEPLPECPKEPEDPVPDVKNGIEPEKEVEVAVV